MLRSVAHCGLAIALGIAWFMTGPLMIGLLDFQAEFIWFSAFRVYHLLCYGITAIMFGYGLAWIGDRAKRWLGKFKFQYTAVAAIMLAVLCGSVALHWQQNNRSDYTWARDLAMFKLSLVEPNASLFTFDDLDLPVGYLHMVEKVRPDLEVFNDQGLVFTNRLFDPFFHEDARKQVLKEYVSQSEPRPIFYHTHRTDFFKTPEQGSDFLGFWRRVNRDNNSDRIVLSESLRIWVENNITEGSNIDRWTRQQAQGVVATLISAIYQASLSGYELSPEWLAVIEKAYATNPLTHLYLLWNIAAIDNGITRETARSELRWIDSLFEQQDKYIFDNESWTTLLFLKSQILRRYPNLADGAPGQAYEATLLEALEYTNHIISLQNITSYYRGLSRHDDVLKLYDSIFPDISTAPVVIRQLYDLVQKEQQEGKILAPVIQFN